MGVRQIYEATLDGPSVIVWEGGKGQRIVYLSESQAESVYNQLISKANQFHLAKEANDGAEDGLMVTVECYGEPMSEFQFIRRFLSIVKSAGYEVHNGLTRPEGEYW